MVKILPFGNGDRRQHALPTSQSVRGGTQNINEAILQSMSFGELTLMK